MPYYNPDLIQQVLDANDIVDVISQYVPLKKRGNRYVACCPFHQEKTPSFTVNRDENFYYCFGCHESGNTYTFLQKKENMSFPEAVEYLANRANITLPKNETKKEIKNIKEKQEIYNINAKAGNYFYKNLKQSKKALGYLVDRGIPHDIIREFGLGYSKPDWSDLNEYLISQKIDPEMIKKAGLIRSSLNGRIYDFFRDRLIIPIQNPFGKVIAFGGRKFNDEDQGPKYMNTSDTPVFNKKEQLFNLNRAKSLVREEPLILVEGYMDVIALYSYGIKNSVAALGTAFTSDHVKLISRYTNNVVLCFDGDQAGEKATDKAIKLLEKSDLKVQVLRLPEVHDPDSYIRENGVEAFKEKLKSAISITDYKINKLQNEFNLTKSDELIDFIMKSCQILLKLSPVEQEIYTRKIAEIAGIELDTIKEQLNKLKTEPVQTKKYFKPKQENQIIQKTTPRNMNVPRELIEAQNIFLGYSLNNREFLISSRVTEEMIIGKFYKWLFNTIKEPDDIKRSELERENLEKLNRFKNKVSKASLSIATQAVDVIKKYYRKMEISKLEAALEKDDMENQQNLFDKILNLKKVDWVNQ